MKAKETQEAASPDVKSPGSPEDERKLSKMNRELESLKTRISVIKAEIDAYPTLDRPETSSDELRESLARSRNKLAYLKQANARIDKQIKRYESEIAGESK